MQKSRAKARKTRLYYLKSILPAYLLPSVYEEMKALYSEIDEMEQRIADLEGRENYRAERDT